MDYTNLKKRIVLVENDVRELGTVVGRQERRAVGQGEIIDHADVSAVERMVDSVTRCGQIGATRVHIVGKARKNHYNTRRLRHHH